jgi:hypothetical protein
MRATQKKKTTLANEARPIRDAVAVGHKILCLAFSIGRPLIAHIYLSRSLPNNISTRNFVCFAAEPLKIDVSNVNGGMMRSE